MARQERAARVVTINVLGARPCVRCCVCVCVSVRVCAQQSVCDSLWLVAAREGVQGGCEFALERLGQRLDALAARVADAQRGARSLRREG